MLFYGVITCITPEYYLICLICEVLFFIFQELVLFMLLVKIHRSNSRRTGHTQCVSDSRNLTTCILVQLKIKTSLSILIVSLDNLVYTKITAHVYHK